MRVGDGDHEEADRSGDEEQVAHGFASLSWLQKGTGSGIKAP
jgi:hypothetical protein